MTRILTVIGARPQFIKAAALSRHFAGLPGREETLIHTGQHFDANMSDVFFEEFGIAPPARNLGVSGASHGAATGRMLEGLEQAMIDLAPDWVLVYGDTNSTIAGALAAAKLHIPVAHVEAGLRSFNRAMPEEINRVLTDHCSDILFTPTDTATAHLRREGIPEARICQSGDVMFDVALAFGEIATRKSGVLAENGLVAGRYVLSTIHRQENTDDPDRLRAILAGLQRVSRDWPVVLPVHPRTRARIEAQGLGPLTEGLTLLAPVGYLDMVALERAAAVIATDSGGIQKEAFFHKVPCVTLRDETEWTELVEAGWNRLCPPVDESAIAAAVLAAVGTSGAPIAPYGAGNAAAIIAARLTGD